MDSAWKICFIVLALSLLRVFVPDSNPQEELSNLSAQKTPGTFSDSIDEKLLYSTTKYPKPKSHQALRNQLARVLRTASEDATTIKVADYVVRATNYILDESIPQSSELPTLVTGVWEVAEKDSELSGAIPWILRFMKHSLPKIIFTDSATYQRIRHIAGESADSQTTFVLLSASQIENGMGQTALQDIYNVRTNPAFLQLAGWIPKSLLGTSQAQTILALSKPMLLREASRMNPFNTPTFIWIDALDACMTESVILTPKHAPSLNKLLDRTLAPFMTRELNPSAKEVLGFRQPSYSFYSGKPATSDAVQIIRSSFFGGKPGQLEILAAVHELLLRASVKEGLLGNLEAYMSIIAERYPDFFHLINDESTCSDSSRTDKTCETSNTRDKAVNGKCGLVGLVSANE
eukprot:c13283_g1_i1.p1 GENE.c13283_g1_i1~~c13283_g1_i1.p1  ORF type:complete len:419 (+),score=94.56 c13283_g1_i1:43-1257(+)